MIAPDQIPLPDYIRRTLAQQSDTIISPSEDDLWGGPDEPLVPCRGCRNGGVTCSC